MGYFPKENIRQTLCVVQSIITMAPSTEPDNELAEADYTLAALN